MLENIKIFVAHLNFRGFFRTNEKAVLYRARIFSEFVERFGILLILHLLGYLHTDP